MRPATLKLREYFWSRNAVGGKGGFKSNLVAIVKVNKQEASRWIAGILIIILYMICGGEIKSARVFSDSFIPKPFSLHLIRFIL